ncbi:MAG: hypothetical protein Q9190_004658 [Brigantiaea leucoxantha]
MEDGDDVDDMDDENVEGLEKAFFSLCDITPGRPIERAPPSAAIWLQDLPPMKLNQT